MKKILAIGLIFISLISIGFVWGMFDSASQSDYSMSETIGLIMYSLGLKSKSAPEIQNAINDQHIKEIVSGSSSLSQLSQVQIERQKKLSEADKYYKKGVEFFERTKDKGADFNEMNKKAREEFIKARDIYRELKDSTQDSAICDIADGRLNEIIRYLTAIRKQSPINMDLDRPQNNTEPHRN